jgi:Ca2+-binding RTX toxin-like protein
LYNDHLYGDHRTDRGNTLAGQDGHDFLQGGLGADTLDGGSGFDYASYGDSAEGVVVSLVTGRGYLGMAEGDTLIDVESIAGSDHGDMLTGDGGRNQLDGKGGADILDGGDDVDWLWGRTGNDRLKGGGGADILDGGLDVDTMLGGKGNDIYRVDTSADVVIEAIDDGYDTVRTFATYVLAAGSEVESLLAQGFADIDLVGNEFNNSIIGNDATNTIVGSPGADGGGYDGLDTMTGGGGGDVFVWTSTAETDVAGHEADVVTDFNRAQGDQLAVNPIDAIEGGDDDAFSFIGVFDGAFEAAGQIAYFTTATDTYVLLNTDADATQEMTIRLAGVHAIDAGWFAL